MQYTCRDCQKKFGNKHCLIRHVLETHAGSENGRLLFTCKNCDKSYRNERDLKAHKERLCPAISLKNTTQHYQVRMASSPIMHCGLDGIHDVFNKQILFFRFPALFARDPSRLHTLQNITAMHTLADFVQLFVIQGRKSWAT